MLNRLYNDYLMPNRYKEYENLLKLFLKNDFKFICIKDYEKLKENDGKYIILRHDIDSDVNIAKQIFKIEKSLNIHSTYYFRLATMNKEFMQDIIKNNSEVGYHYEEIAQFCKDNKNISKDFVEDNIINIREKLTNNIKKIQNEYGVKLNSIAAHGDFVNRKLQISNQYVYNEEMKKRLNLIEAYDIEDLLDFRTADKMYPEFWKDNPENAILANKKKVLILIHPRWWNKAPLERAKIDLMRLKEGIFLK